MLALTVDKIKAFPGAKQDYAICVDIDAKTYGYGDWKFPKPLCFKGSAENTGEVIHVLGSISGKLLLSCSRCGEKFYYSLDTADIAIDAFYMLGGNKADQEGEKDIYAFQGDIIDITSEALKAIFVELPMQMLCSEDCRGLCPYCGQNQNLGSCECKDNHIDPRLAILKNLIVDDEKKGV